MDGMNDKQTTEKVGGKTRGNKKQFKGEGTGGRARGLGGGGGSVDGADST